MIKEVEVRNTTELLDSDPTLVVDFENTPDIVTAILTSNGMVMTAKVNRNLKTDYFRKVSLYYILPTYEQQTVTEYELGVFDLSDTVDATTEYVFDLSPIMSSIAHPMTEQLADQTVSIRVYTYEANVVIDYGTSYPLYSGTTQWVVNDVVQYNGRLYLCTKDSLGNLPSNGTYWQSNIIPSSGTKTLHAPYSVSYPGVSVIPASTDGWYNLRVVDVAAYTYPNNTTVYYPNDIVYDDSSGTGGMFFCILTDDDAYGTANETYWEPLSAERERNMYGFGYEQSSSDTIATLLNTDMLVTRYVKQKYIYDLLVKSNYKRHDNITVVTQLEKIFAMREAAVAHLYAGNVIFARYLLDMITIEYNSYTSNVGNKTVVAIASNFTL
jgi:hypothetical protein